MSYTCQYCRKDFVKESSLAVHSCEPHLRDDELDLMAQLNTKKDIDAYLKQLGQETKK